MFLTSPIFSDIPKETTITAQLKVSIKNIKIIIKGCMMEGVARAVLFNKMANIFMYMDSSALKSVLQLLSILKSSCLGVLSLLSGEENAVCSQICSTGIYAH